MTDSLGDRMKGYEEVARQVLPRRVPLIMRIDGKAFHTYTKGCECPFDLNLSNVMVSTMRKLCEEIQGAQLAYTQSDEISILIHGYKRFESQTWFDGQVQKMVSVAASIAGATFTLESWRVFAPKELLGSAAGYQSPAYFDARVFMVPEADVCNYFLWRQQDATRNSIQMLARAHFSHKQCENKNGVELKEMCAAKGVVWDELDSRWRRGLCLRRAWTSERNPWHLDDKIPLFNEERNYINNLLKVEEE